MTSNAPLPKAFPGDTVWVICLCADWCHLCRDYREVIDTVARGLTGFRGFQFAWLDIEDHAGMVGEMDIETFPTLLVADAAGMLFFGALTPQASILRRLLESLAGAAPKRQPHTAATQSLVQALPAQPQLHLRSPENP
ncbi:MAG: thioredoxin [Polaromonas sp.]|uniref:thioredoxin domain-containing protein n=1 Tax=Polaromonas sp. TaxID=1869339 RepID=UPI0025DB8FFA|nr:thioredoxin domain-containing protein [Polaromonas sp.]MBI2726755.1 thioredoxin [Polaromonas sp.]